MLDYFYEYVVMQLKSQSDEYFRERNQFNNQTNNFCYQKIIFYLHFYLFGDIQRSFRVSKQNYKTKKTASSLSLYKYNLLNIIMTINIITSL